MIIKAKAIKFGNNVNTDVILPGKYLELIDPKELAKHAMAGIDPDFPDKVSDGAVLIGGKNFGCGSSREQAPIALKFACVGCILAESVARIFYRNAINIGLPVLEMGKGSGKIEEGDVISVYLLKGEIMNETKNHVTYAKKLPDFVLEIINDGGLIEHLIKKRGMEK